MASTSKGKFCSAMLYKIKVFVFSFSLGSNHKTNVISEKKKMFKGTCRIQNAVHVH